MQNAEQIECRMQSAECRVIEFRVGDGAHDIPKSKRILVHEQSTGRGREE